MSPTTDRRHLDESFRPEDDSSGDVSQRSIRPNDTGSTTDIHPVEVDIGGGSMVETPQPKQTNGRA